MAGNPGCEPSFHVIPAKVFKVNPCVHLPRINKNIVSTDMNSCIAPAVSEIFSTNIFYDG